MKQLTLILLFLAGWTIVSGQEKKEKIPSKIQKDIPKLTEYLTKNCENETQKVEAVYAYITSNIKFDVKYLEKNNCGRFEGPSEVLKNKKSTCMGYVYLMGAMLDELKIEWELISGYTNVSYPYYVPKYLVDDHAWIAINVNGDWKLADPTWDAGYVGALPKKDTRPSAEKQQKKIDKILKKNEKLLAQGKELKEVPELDTAKDNVEYTKRIGFVQKSTREWFLVPADSFLLRHLPANPLWQLRKPEVPIEVFSHGADSIQSYVEANQSTGYPVADVDGFYHQPVLDKILANGVIGNQFNKANTRTTVVHYHRFLEILNLPEVKKHFKGLPDKYSRALNQKMIQISDSTIKLVKSAQAVEKNRHKEVTTACGKGFKNANSGAKKFQTSTEKIKKWGEKTIATLDKTDLKLNTDIDRLKLADEKKPKPSTSLDFDPIAKVHKSIVQLTDSIDKMEAGWLKSVADSNLQKIAGNTQYSEFVIGERSKILQQKSLHLYQYVELADRILLSTVGKLDTLYNDSLNMEVYPLAINKVAFQLAKIDRLVEKGLSEAIAQNKIKDANAYRTYYNDLAEYYQGVAKKHSAEAARHNEYIRNGISILSDSWKDISDYSADQEKLAKEKNDHVLEDEEHTHNREEDMLKIISEESAKWKAKLQGK